MPSKFLLTKWQEMNSPSDMFSVYCCKHGSLFVTRIGYFQKQTQGGGKKSEIYRVKVANNI